MKNSLKLFSLVLFVTQFGFAACVPAGTAGDDVVVCTGTVNGYQYMRGGSDKVTLTNVSGNGVFWLDDSTHGNPATDGNDSFYASDSHFNWVFGFGGDDYFEVNSSDFNNIYPDTNPAWVMQRGNDTVVVRSSVSHGYILGGNDSDTITVIDSNVSNVVSGYSNIKDPWNWVGDYTPYDSNDTIMLDHVNFNVPLYWDTNYVQGVASGGKGDDKITMIHGGEAYYIYGGHGSDTIEIFDGEHFNECNTSTQIPHRCGIYGDENYDDELNASQTPFLHGDDRILIHDASLDRILVQGGDGSDYLLIEQPVSIRATDLDGGDDTSAADGFVDRVQFEQWIGDLNGSQFANWEQIYLHNASSLTMLDTNISAGSDSGVDSASGLPYGLIVEENSQLNIYHDFTIYANLHNNAIVNMQDGGTPGVALSVENNYTASGGSVYLDTVLNDASPSISDRLVVQGNTQGNTVLHINNIGGAGGQTPTADNSGILVVEVQGDSNGNFSLSAPLQTADYWYHLIKGSNGNWYLQSEAKIYELNILKTLSQNMDEDHSGDISLGDTLIYEINATNTGNTTLHNVVVSDAMITPSNNTCTTLAPSEVCTLSGSYTITQSDVDAGEINNSASALSDEASKKAVVHLIVDVNSDCYCEEWENDRVVSMKWFLLLFEILPMMVIIIYFKSEENEI